MYNTKGGLRRVEEYQTKQSPHLLVEDNRGRQINLPRGSSKVLAT